MTIGLWDITGVSKVIPDLQMDEVIADCWGEMHSKVLRGEGGKSEDKDSLGMRDAREMPDVRVREANSFTSSTGIFDTSIFTSSKLVNPRPYVLYSLLVNLLEPEISLKDGQQINTENSKILMI